MKFGNCFKVHNGKALSANDFRHLFEAALTKLPHKKAELIDARVALAISGGSDSMALAALASECLGKDKVLGLIVDHKLEDFGVSENSEKVQENLDRLGIRSNIVKLSWENTFPGEQSIIPGKVMMKSREKRYKALFEMCKNENIPLLLTGHNLEDDIVTMFYRISRMSGLDGLAGMKQVSTFPFAAPNSDSTFILRPLLSVPKQCLINTCIEREINWNHDQSNDDLSFRRNECLQALIQLQSENKNININSLTQMLESFKGHRAYIHQKVTDVFSKSVILSKTVGDATLVLNNQSLIKNNFLFNRVLTALIQFTTVSPYPPKTPSLNRIYKDIHNVYTQYQSERNTKNYHPNVNYKKLDNFKLTDKPIKRIEFPQHTLASASVYALSKNDTARRLSNFQARSGKKIVPGPSLLVQREFPSKKNLQVLNAIIHDFSDCKPYLWDNRIFLGVRAGVNSDSTTSLVFNIKPLSVELVKEFEKLTAKDFSSRKNLYAYLGMTPGSHLHTIPVLVHVETGYMAIPTLMCYSDRNMFIWEFFNASIGVYASKFLCLP